MGDFEKLIEAAKSGNVADVRDIAQRHADLINQRDSLGATALHHAAFGGHRDVVRALVKKGAEVNAADGEFGAPPTGWAIEYLREMGGFLGIELHDFAYAIQRGQTEWVARFLKRFPALREARDTQGTPFRMLAQESGNVEIAEMFVTETRR
jgi:ankyrin repeat protein